jgi:predicted lipoprotein with Yx(FWY)xxD motif
MNMTLNRSLTRLASAGAISLTALAFAACGGGSGTNDSPASNERSATIGVASTDLGNVLVDSNSRTLYVFERDEGTTSVCNGTCATEWPPVLANGKSTVGDGASASLVATTKRSDETAQVTYNGHPVYRYYGDENPGDTNGQGLTTFGGAWYALSTAGDQVSGAGSGGGYAY